MSLATNIPNDIVMIHSFVIWNKIKESITAKLHKKYYPFPLFLALRGMSSCQKPMLWKYLPKWLWEPWSSGYGWRLMFERSWVWILAPYTGWRFGHFFTLIFCKNCVVCLKRPKINQKEARVGPFFKKTFFLTPLNWTVRFYSQSTIKISIA